MQKMSRIEEELNYEMVGNSDADELPGILRRRKSGVIIRGRVRSVRGAGIRRHAIHRRTIVIHHIRRWGLWRGLLLAEKCLQLLHFLF